MGTSELNLIILIDDDHLINMLHSAIIERKKCTKNLIHFDNAENALEYFNQTSNQIPELLFVDLNMPRMNGWEFLDAFEECYNHLSQPPVIFILSTSINPDDEKRAHENTMVSGFINKPLDHDKLNLALNQFKI